MCEICEDRRLTLNGTPRYNSSGNLSIFGSYYDEYGSQTPWQAEDRARKANPFGIGAAWNKYRGRPFEGNYDKRLYRRERGY